MKDDSIVCMSLAWHLLSSIGCSYVDVNPRETLLDAATLQNRDSTATLWSPEECA